MDLFVEAFDFDRVFNLYNSFKIKIDCPSFHDCRCGQLSVFKILHPQSYLMSRSILLIFQS